MCVDRVGFPRRRDESHDSFVINVNWTSISDAWQCYFCVSNILRTTGTAGDPPSPALFCHDPTICRLVTSHIWVVVFNIVVAILLPGGLFCTANDLRTINMPTPHDVWELYFLWEGEVVVVVGGGGWWPRPRWQLIRVSGVKNLIHEISSVEWEVWVEVGGWGWGWGWVPSHRWRHVTPACAGINNPSLRRRDISRRSRLPRRWRRAACRPWTPLRHPSQLTGCANRPKVAPDVQEPVTRKAACQLWLWWRFSQFCRRSKGEGSFPNRLGAAGFETNLPLNI